MQSTYLQANPYPPKLDAASAKQASTSVDADFIGNREDMSFCMELCTKSKNSNAVSATLPRLVEAMRQGYLPCAACKPVRNLVPESEALSQAMDLLEAHDYQKITAYQLKQNQLEPAVINRVMEKSAGLTFQAFQRLFRINRAFLNMQNKVKKVESKKVKSTTQAGFEYLIEKSKRKTVRDSTIVLQRIQTPLGPMYLAATQDGVCLLEFTDRRMLETEFADLQLRLKTNIVAGENEHTIQIKKELKEYFMGKRMRFETPLDMQGTTFQKNVWEQLLNIPFGATASYGEQAKRMGNKKAVRAVAAANGYNKMAIVVPCHRVVGADGDLRGYGGGVDRKAWLLDFERHHTSLFA